MKINQLYKFFKESATTDITNLPTSSTQSTTDANLSKTSTLGTAGKGGGKSLDGIAAGTSTPYKEVNPKTETPFEKQFQNLKGLVEKARNEALNGSKFITGDAKSDFEKLLELGTMEKDDDGDIIIPFGSNMRVREDNGDYYLLKKD